MQHHYGVDLSGLWRGELTLRRVAVLLAHLPPDCASARAVAGTTGQQLTGWSFTNLLLGRLIDELAILRWQWESAHLDKRHRPRPQPPTVLPELTERDTPALLSPHELGPFINSDDPTTALREVT